MKVIYLDLLFGINVAMDVVLLTFVAVFWRKPKRWRRIFAAAFFGGVWACLVTVNRQQMKPWLAPGVFDCLTWTLISACMTKIAFQSRGRQTLLYQVTLFIMAFLVGGAVDALYYHTKTDVSMLALVVGILLIGFGGGLLLHAWRRGMEAPDIRMVKVAFRGKEIQVNALYDSGNRLYDPISGAPVHVLELAATEGILTDREQEELRAFPNITESSFLLRAVPYVSVGQENGLLPVLRMDSLHVDGDAPYVLTHPLIGFSFHPLNQHGGYRMILHPMTDEQKSETWEDGRI